MQSASGDDYTSFRSTQISKAELTLDYKAVCLQDLGEDIASVLCAPVGVEDQLLGNWPVPDWKKRQS